MVDTQLCKLRDTSDTLIGRACAMFQLKYDVCELHLIYDTLVDTQFHKFYDRPFSRGLYLFLMKDIGRGQQDDFTRTMLSITILRTDTM